MGTNDTYISQEKNVQLANLIKEKIVPVYEVKGWNVILFYSQRYAGEFSNCEWEFKFYPKDTVPTPVTKHELMDI